MKSGRASWQKAEETRKDFNIVLTRQDKKFVIFELFKVVQDAISLILHYRTNVLNPDDFFKYIYHVGCAINLHSIINSGLIPGGQNSSKRQTVFFLSVNPMDKEHKDPETIDLRAPRLAQYMHKTWKKHQKHGVLGRHQICSKERIKVLSNAIERHHPLQYTPSLLYPESCSDGNWRNHIQKSL